MPCIPNFDFGFNVCGQFTVFKQVSEGKVIRRVCRGPRIPTSWCGRGCRARARIKQREEEVWKKYTLAQVQAKEAPVESARSARFTKIMKYSSSRRPATARRIHWDRARMSLLPLVTNFFCIMFPFTDSPVKIT